jgi:hypothetical protein
VWEPSLGLEDGRVDECFDAARDDTGVYTVGRILGDAGQDAWVGRYTGWPPMPSTYHAVTQNEFRDAFHAMVVHEDGDRVLVGSRDDHDIWVVRFDPTYQLRWETAHAGDANDNDKAWDVGFAPDGTLLVVGYETTVDEGANMWLRRYAP